MKVKLRKKKEPKPALKRKGRRGPVPTIGGNRCNFFPGDCFKGLVKLNRLLEEAGIRRKVTQSFAAREGARQWIRKQISDAKKATEGKLHAKRRRD